MICAHMNKYILNILPTLLCEYQFYCENIDTMSHEKHICMFICTYVQVDKNPKRTQT